MIHLKRAGSFILVLDVTRWGRFQDADESAYYEFICRRADFEVHYVAEQFSNDGSLQSNLMKNIKRNMAGEYSRELSVKVFAGQCRLIEKGYSQGGPAGYGLRRMLIDEQGNEKGTLKRGEHKSLQTDRVILVPGPQDEIDTVRWLSGILIDEAEEMPSSSAYAHRLGSLLRAYELVEYTPDQNMRYIETNRHIRSLYPDICEGVIHRIQDLGGTIHREVTSDMIVVNNEVNVSIVISRCFQTKAGRNRWKVRLDSGLRPDITIVIRMDEMNEKPLDYYILPALDVEDPHPSSGWLIIMV